MHTMVLSLWLPAVSSTAAPPPGRVLVARHFRCTLKDTSPIMTLTDAGDVDLHLAANEAALVVLLFLLSLCPEGFCAFR
jgi:hypothetical protein